MIFDTNGTCNYIIRCLMYWSNILHDTSSCVLSDVKEETSCCCVKIFVKWCRKYLQSGGGAAVLLVVKSLLIIDIVRLTGFHFNYHTVPLAPSFKHFPASPRLVFAQHNVIIYNASTCMLYTMLQWNTVFTTIAKVLLFNNAKMLLHYNVFIEI